MLRASHQRKTSRAARGRGTKVRGRRSAAPRAGDGGLPAVWHGPRRGYLSLLVGTGLAQAVGVGVGAHVLRHWLHANGGRQHQGWLVATLVTVGVGAGLLRMAERIQAERLAQHYVHDVRLGLLRHNLGTGLSSSLGVAVARTTNDLASVKNWVAMGIAPLTVAVATIAGTAVVLALLAPVFLVALVIPIVFVTAAIAVLSPRAYAGARTLRRARGRLSGHIADTVLATDSIRSGGGGARELRRIESMSQDLVNVAVARARWAGALRGATAAGFGLTSALVVGAAIVAGLPATTTTTALAVVSFLAMPMHDLGRVAEYRQTYRAARRIIAPVVQAVPEPHEVPAPAISGTTPRAAVVISGVITADGAPVPDLEARPGDCIVVDLGDRQTTAAVLRRIAGLSSPVAGAVTVHGISLDAASPRALRSAVGYAAQGMWLPRGTISRAVRYRVPDGTECEAQELLQRLGFERRLAALPRGMRTVIRQGGDPLTISGRATVLLARAMFGTPPLLILDHLDADLGHESRAVLSDVLASYPGVVLLAADHTADLVDQPRRWLLPQSQLLQ